MLDKRKDPWGDYLENLGFYNPMVKPKEIKLKAERIKYWISKGAQPTDTVWNLLVSEKVVEGKKRKAHAAKKKKEKKEEAPKEEKKEEVKEEPAKEETKPEEAKEESKPEQEDKPKEEPAKEEAKPEKTE